jgi:hypothetical protein
MADINNPQAIRFVNEQVRPLCEEVRALKAKFDALAPLWYGGINALITNSAQDNIEDGREAEGISRLTGADIHNAVGQFLAIAPNTEIIAKPCVRSIQVS